MNSASISTCFNHELGIYTCAGYNGYGQLGRGHTFSVGHYTNNNICHDAVGGDQATCTTNGGQWKPRNWYDTEYNSSYADNLDYNNIDDDADNDTYINFLNTDSSDFVEDIQFMPKDLQASYYNTCALQERGSIVCLGRNNYGQLGRNSTTDRITTLTYRNYLSSYVGFGSSMFSNIQDFSLGYVHGCAVKNSNEIICWGYNSYYNLGLPHNNNVGTGTWSYNAGSENALVVKPGKGFPTYKNY